MHFYSLRLVIPTLSSGAFAALATDLRHFQTGVATDLQQILGLAAPDLQQNYCIFVRFKNFSHYQKKSLKSPLSI